MRRKGVMSLLGIALIVCMMNLVAFAASSPLSASQEKSFVFAVPEGGWSSATVSVNYAEYFTTKCTSHFYCIKDIKNKYPSFYLSTHCQSLFMHQYFILCYFQVPQYNQKLVYNSPDLSI